MIMEQNGGGKNKHVYLPVLKKNTVSPHTFSTTTISVTYKPSKDMIGGSVTSVNGFGTIAGYTCLLGIDEYISTKSYINTFVLPFAK